MTNIIRPITPPPDYTAAETPVAVVRPETPPPDYEEASAVDLGNISIGEYSEEEEFVLPKLVQLRITPQETGESDKKIEAEVIELDEEDDVTEASVDAPETRATRQNREPKSFTFSVLHIAKSRIYRPLFH